MSLKKVISGGQTGADQAGLVVAKNFGLKTGGWMPKNFKTLEGPRPDMAVLFGCQEHPSNDYASRTERNVFESDGTVRLAGVFTSRGENCTLRAIKKYKKPHIDIDLTDLPPLAFLVDWIKNHNIEVLNVAGNSEETYSGSFRKSQTYLMECFFDLGLEMSIKPETLLASLQVSNVKLGVFNEETLVSLLKIKKFE